MIERVTSSNGEQRGRPIRSFVRRSGRMTRAQGRSLEKYWGTYGIAGEGVVDMDVAFGRRAPRYLEIGFGMGGALLTMAEGRPGHDFLGVDVFEPGIGHVLGRVAALQLGNIRLLRGDAVDILGARLPAGGLDGVYLYFPDPWPKKRHHKRRLVQPPFVSLVARCMRSGGRFLLATDWEDYAHHMLQVVEAHAGW
ncbi:MAG: tRNA (guanosine(46)-N7)-methyltransferase TrmB, partial [Gammaproteobacteria bacterium]